MDTTWKWFLTSTAIIAFSIGLFYLDSDDAARNPDRLGTALAWSPDFPFGKHQAQILAAGLGDTRGIAVGQDGNVFLSEANGDTLVYSEQGYKGSVSSMPGACSKEPCDVADQRGLTVFGSNLYIAEHGRGENVRIDLKHSHQKNDAIVNGADQRDAGPTGLTAVGNTLFMTDDRPWPATGEDSSYDSADYARWLDKGTPRLFGAAYACTLDPQGNCVGQPAQVGSRLRHPTGVAALCAGGPVYIAESDSNQVRWPIFRSADAKWKPSGALGSIPVHGAQIASFLGVAVDDKGQFVFAAGPGGLYVFSPEGDSLGRILFDEPVSGVAYQDKKVYLVVGRMLCRLYVNGKPLPPGQPCMTSAPPPKPDEQKPSHGRPSPPMPSKHGEPSVSVAQPPPDGPPPPRPDNPTPKPHIKRKARNCDCSGPG